ncbi:MAG: hypothetical protein ACI83W_002302 [Marinoscillum sp.]|jgi:hypothetical protein
MELDLTTELAGTYRGKFISTSATVKGAVTVIRKDNLSIQVSYENAALAHAFEVQISDQKEGRLFRIPSQQLRDFVIAGISGFINQKPNVHGGFINDLSSLYFHVHVIDKSGSREIFFMGDLKKMA